MERREAATATRAPFSRLATGHASARASKDRSCVRPNYAWLGGLKQCYPFCPPRAMGKPLFAGQRDGGLAGYGQFGERRWQATSSE